jgi:hypothetical protein
MPLLNVCSSYPENNLKNNLISLYSNFKPF